MLELNSRVKGTWSGSNSDQKATLACVVTILKLQHCIKRSNFLFEE